ncbi:hypothetical protein KL86DPRO_60223 [uncultured delta proteobacterium]|uniref:Uncharacterized protein n=1 Tax=uncultured delta proteobacterium TaxID=34034 RepID=A0A212KFX2_9DELT|nr:hypothetical protein KL86DPRO_60223 [uncultured delta proteobacterium]
MIHPERLTRYEEWQDYIKRDALCRQLEKEYGLAVDFGRDKNRQKQRLQEKAAIRDGRGRTRHQHQSFGAAQLLEDLE